MSKSKILAALFCAIPTLIPAAEIEISEPISTPLVAPYTWESMERIILQGEHFDFSDYLHIRITGDIAEGDARRLADLALDKSMSRWNQDINQFIIVSFNSTGGNYLEGLGLSDLIQRMNAATYVGAGDECLSACALAWLGGRQEVIRRVMWQPTRFVHVDGHLGFHAPFNNEYPTDMGSLGQEGIEFVASQFYALANESIRELQKRLTGWQIHPNFAFELLGKGHDEFLLIEQADHLFRNNITALDDNSRFLSQIGSLEALAVCNYALRTTVEPAVDYQDAGNLPRWPDFSDPEHLLSFGSTSKGDLIEKTSDGRDRFIIHDWIAGRGNFECQVENDLGAWVVHLSGDLPMVPTKMGNVVKINDGAAFFVSEHNALGVTTPWHVLKGDDLWLRSDPFDAVPADYQKGSGPSFDCDGDLDPAAQVICAFPTLSRADAIMVSLYREKRDQEGVTEAQREWIHDRNRSCRIAHINPDEETSFRISGYCLLAFNLARIKVLMEA